MRVALGNEAFESAWTEECSDDRGGGDGFSKLGMSTRSELAAEAIRRRA